LLMSSGYIWSYNPLDWAPVLQYGSGFVTSWPKYHSPHITTNCFFTQFYVPLFFTDASCVWSRNALNNVSSSPFDSMFEYHAGGQGSGASEVNLF
jgi:hypothetical protein